MLNITPISVERIKARLAVIDKAGRGNTTVRNAARLIGLELKKAERGTRDTGKPVEIIWPGEL